MVMRRGTEVATNGAAASRPVLPVSDAFTATIHGLWQRSVSLDALDAPHDGVDKRTDGNEAKDLKQRRLLHPRCVI